MLPRLRIKQRMWTAKYRRGLHVGMRRTSSTCLPADLRPTLSSISYLSMLASMRVANTSSSIRGHVAHSTRGNT